VNELYRGILRKFLDKIYFSLDTEQNPGLSKQILDGCQPCQVSMCQLHDLFFVADIDGGSRPSGRHASLVTGGVCSLHNSCGCHSPYCSVYQVRTELAGFNFNNI